MRQSDQITFSSEEAIAASCPNFTTRLLLLISDTVFVVLHSHSALLCLSGPIDQPRSVPRFGRTPSTEAAGGLATGRHSARNDDISMINERLLAQDPGGGKSSWSPAPVDVDVGGEINQYELRQQIQGASSSERLARGTTHEVRNGARSKRAAASTTIATALQQSDGSLGAKLETISNKTGGGREEGQQQTDDNLKCRLEKDWYMEFGQYKRYACANCYRQVFISSACLFHFFLIILVGFNDQKTSNLLLTREVNTRFLIQMMACACYLSLQL